MRWKGHFSAAASFPAGMQAGTRRAGDALANPAIDAETGHHRRYSGDIFRRQSRLLIVLRYWGLGGEWIW
jgi:hypothetical protein